MFVLTLAKIYINLVSANLFVLNLGKKKRLRQWLVHDVVYRMCPYYDKKNRIVAK